MRYSKRIAGTRSALAGMLAVLPGLSVAQNVSTSDAAARTLEEIVVTGTSIRGAPPVGSNLITIGRDEIEATSAQTLQQILTNVTAVTGFGNAAQGAFGSADGAGTFAPTIHGLGASASNGTLILVDGHRLPLSGINHTLVDPNVIAPLAIERVEVLPDAASSTYGSDAVAGVLNFITRRNYSGLEISGQAGFGDEYNSHSVNALYGDVWDNGSILFSYGYSHRDSLSSADRAYTRTDHRAQGGGNFANNNCSPATVQAGPSIFAYPYTAGPVTVPGCDFTAYTDLLPKNDRHNVLVKLTRDVGDQLFLSADLVYSKQATITAINRGTVTATVYGPTATAPAANSRNPFIAGPTAANGTQTVRFQADDLLGPGAQNQAGGETFFVTGGAEYKLGGDWVAALGTTIGQDDTYQKRVNALCVSCATLALNGPGLTAANALDVWSPVGSNRTSQAVRNMLTDSTTFTEAHQTIKDAILKVDGPLFNIPGGPVRLAVGGEYTEYRMDQEVLRERGTGPASSNSATTFLVYDRSVKSAFAEMLVPIVGPDNDVPLIRSLDVNVSGRYDEYSDFGDTTNPKFALSWEVFDGFNIRGNVARSFTAPALTSRGNAQGITAESGYTGFIFGPTVIPTAAYPNAIGLPGCPPGSVTCTISDTAGLVPGIVVTGGNKDLQPQKGKTFSVGFDVAPAAIPGLRFSATYWNAQYNGAITAPVPGFAVNAAGLNHLLTIYPGGATPAQIAAATAGLTQTGAFNTPVYFIYSFQQRNALNLEADGIDAEIHYSMDSGIGTFDTSLSVSKKLTMDQQVGTGGQWFSVLDTSGFNTTFPSNELAARLNLGWRREGMSANVFVNYSGDYYNWSGGVATGRADWALVRRNGVPIGGGQPIDAYTTVDLNLSYSFGSEGLLSDTKIFFDATNVLDEDPPFYNSAQGYDTFSASPIGRVLTVGMSKKW